MGWWAKKPLHLVFERGRGRGGVKQGVGGRKSPSVTRLSNGGVVVVLNEGLVGKNSPPSRVRVTEGWWWAKKPLHLVFERGRGSGEVKRGVGGQKSPLCLVFE